MRFHRKQVERLAQLLETDGAPRRHNGQSQLDDQLAPLVAVGSGLRAVHQPADATPEAEFRTSLRAVLVATAEREGIGRTSTAPEEYRRPPLIRLPSRRARAAVIVGLAAGTLALSGMSAASGDAMPGDALYGVKRSTEGARLALAGSDMNRGVLYLEFAKNRAGEAVTRDDDAPGLATLLGDMDNDTRTGTRLLTAWAVHHHDTAALRAIITFVRTQQATLAKLHPDADAARLDQSRNLLSAVQGRAEQLRSGLACHAPAGRIDQLGPTPTACAATGGYKPGGSTGTPTGAGQAPQTIPGPQPGSPSPTSTAGTRSADRDTPSPTNDGRSGTIIGDLTGMLGGAI